MGKNKLIDSTPKKSINAISYEPMLAKLSDKVFDSPEWIYEKKLDGYRCLAYTSEKVKLLSRNGLDFGDKYATITKALAKLSHEAVIDGELVIEDKEGRSLFNEIQNYNGDKGTLKLRFYVFDILALDGHDLRQIELTKRKDLLKALVAKLASPAIVYNEHIFEQGTKLFQEAEKKGWEGIIAKNAESTYLSGKRSDNWKKFKIQNSQEAIIIGFSKPAGSRNYFGSLVLAINEGSKLVYIGNVGTGFTEKTLKELHAKMLPLVTDKKPVTEKIKQEKLTTWIKPKLVCEVTFSEWTTDRHLRHPVYKGLRIDKTKKEVVQEISSDEL